MSVCVCMYIYVCGLRRIIIWHRGRWWAVLPGSVSGVKDTSQYIIVERGEVFQRVHHRGDEVVIPLDLRENLSHT